MNDQPTDWPERIEYEVNRHLGGDATVGDIVRLMLRLGWRPPDDGKVADGESVTT